jgi:hypothetical protein
LILANRNALKEEKKANGSSADSDEDLFEHTTLIIVPSALKFQWVAEIQKVAGNALSVQFFDRNDKDWPYKQEIVGKDGEDDQGAPDIVITVYDALQSNSTKACKELMTRKWGRVVLDEMQEVRSFTTAIARNCESLDCDRRWMLSGTPLFEAEKKGGQKGQATGKAMKGGVQDLNGELCFLRLEPFSSKSDDGFFKFAIADHWMAKSRYGLETLQILSLLMLRRSKSMTLCGTDMPLLALKPMSVEFVLVPQTDSERALYCFIEFIVHATLSGQGRGEKSKHLLRLERDACFSPVLLNGGMGVRSQIQKINQLMVRHNRRHHGETAVAGRFNDSRTILSPMDAIRYLSQVNDPLATQTDMVSDNMVSGGGGMHLTRGQDSLEFQLLVADEQYSQADQKIKAARKARCVAFFHALLELVTSGQVYIHSPQSILTPQGRTPPNRTIRSIWRWRYLLRELRSSRGESLPKGVPKGILSRGWRHGPNFETILFRQNPTFLWARPLSLCLEGIPEVATDLEIKKSIIDVLAKRHFNDRDGVERVQITRSLSGTSAVVHFFMESDMKLVLQKSKHKPQVSAAGIELKTDEPIPKVVEAIASAQSKLNDMEEFHDGDDSVESRRIVLDAKRAHNKACQGMRIIFKRNVQLGYVVISLPIEKRRGLTPKTSDELIANTSASIEKNKHVITRNVFIAKDAGKRALTLRRKIDNPSETRGPSTTITLLQELAKTYPQKEEDVVDCTICHDMLGSDEGSEGKMALTRCGHLFCSSCLHRSAEMGQGQQHNCPACRQKIDMERLVYVDPTLTDQLEDRRILAKKVVSEALAMLKASDGQLEPQLWEQLYLSFDAPGGADTRLHSSFTSLPSLFLGHIRHTTSMPVHSAPHFNPGPSDGFQPSSKIQALLNDLSQLPDDERVVVFTSTKIAVQHLVAVLGMKEIGCRALFTGQNIDLSEKAVIEWQSSRGVRVLVLQAGFAAAGLTLTTASKAYLMEPFIRYEEEQQAYARLHRYGQTKNVEIKVYYSPVTVESRLLAWRELAKNETMNNSDVSETKASYTSICVDDEEAPNEADDGEDTPSNEAHESDDDEETDQDRFLLGLTQGFCLVI